MNPIVRTVAEDFVSFLNKAVTPFHAVEECAKKLSAAGFTELLETDDWSVKPLSKCFVRRNRSSIVAFAVGGKFQPGNCTSIIAAHTDSPCLKVKPVSRQGCEGYLQLGVAPYGGGLWRTWFDRDLTLAGRVVFKDGAGIGQKLVSFERPLLHIPNLAIHLETDRTKFEFKKEEHLRPFFATAVCDALNRPAAEKATAEKKDPHHSAFMELLCKEAGVAAGDLLSYDLHLLDAQLATITGLHGEFVAGGRLDNLVGTYSCVWALADSLTDAAAFAADGSLRVAVCFDNEEVGSVSAQGAQSSMLEWVLRRLHPAPLAFETAMPRSLLVSADQAHAVHPNYPNKHEGNHKVGMHKGIVVKINVNQRYATTAVTEAVFKRIAEKSNVPLQEFVVPNDSPCGSTVGPLLAAKLGLQTIDVGTTQLAMHSIREIADASGIAHARQLYKTFYEELPAVLRATAN